MVQHLYLAAIGPPAQLTRRKKKRIAPTLLWSHGSPKPKSREGSNGSPPTAMAVGTTRDGGRGHRPTPCHPRREMRSTFRLSAFENVERLLNYAVQLASFQSLVPGS